MCRLRFGHVQRILTLTLLVRVPPTPGDHFRGPLGRGGHLLWGLLALTRLMFDLLPACREYRCSGPAWPESRGFGPA